MTAYFSYLKKLVLQHNNTDHHSINKKVINADYFASTKNNCDLSKSSYV